MKKSTVGFLLLMALGVAGLLAWKFLDPFKPDPGAAADVKDGQLVRIGGDNYLGYWFLTSPEMRKQAPLKKLKVEFTDDGGAYAERLQKFADGLYDAIVLPINTYLEHGRSHDFPGVAVASLSESKGADGIVAASNRMPSGKINDLDNPALQVVYTADSPSAFLMDLTIADFDLNQLQATGGWRVPLGGSTEVLKQAREGQGDVFVLWEPDLSKALALPNMKYIWGSDKFSGYIVDVIVFRRDFLQKNRTVVSDFLATYFRVLDLYGNNRDKLIKEMARSADLKRDMAEKMLDKIDWFDLGENCAQQFGISTQPGQMAEDGLINSIIACTDVMLRTGRMDKDPLAGNPYLITNRSILEGLARTQTVAGVGRTQAAPASFEALDEAGWGQLRELGTFRVESINFQSWDNLLSDEGKTEVDKFANLLIHNYPAYRIKIRGHTGPSGDEAANEKLSEDRALAVRQYLMAVHGITAERLLAQGAGSKEPPQKRAGESPRAYRYRLSRVEFIAVEGNQL